MRNLFIESIFNPGIVRAFCWTLIHSCWQGLILAMLTGLLILLTRRSRPAIRYNLLAMLFGLFFLSAGLTFVWQLRSAATGGEVGAPAFAPATLSPVSSPALETPLLDNMLKAGSGESWMDRMVNYFNEHAALIVAAWFLVFMVRMAKVLANLGTIRRIRHYKTSAPSEIWTERVRELAHRLHIKRPVALLESALIGVPMMAGVFKPVILVPLGLLSQLPPGQVEAILLHELAHIRRKDYLVNLLQHFAEILFFFNPAVLWLSSLIREERENCCDDIAVEQTRSKREFIHALVSFENYSRPGLQCALAFPGSGNHLLKRVKRIVHRDDKRLSGQEKCFLMACLLIAGGLTMAFSRVGHGAVHPVLSSVAGRSEVAAGATLQNDTVSVVNDTVPLVKPAPAAPAADTASIGERERSTREYRERKQALMEEAQKLKERQQQLSGQQKELQDRQDQLILQYKLLELGGDGMGDRLIEKKLNFENRLKLQRKLDMEKMQTLRENRKMDEVTVLEMKRSREKMLKLDQKQNLDEVKIQRQKMDGDRAMHEWELSSKPLDLRREKMLKLEQGKMLKLDQGKMLKLELGKITTGKMHEVVGPIIEELLQRKVITNTEVLSFSLDKDGLVVNGVRQPAELFGTFKEKYLRDPRNEVKYSRKAGGGESITVNEYK